MLSNYSDRRIKPSEAVSLCQLAHGDNFSVATWEKFLSNRVEGKSAPLAWNDLRIFLCTPQVQKKRSNDPKLRNDSIKRVKLSLNQDDIHRAESVGEYEAKVRG